MKYFKTILWKIYRFINTQPAVVFLKNVILYRILHRKIDGMVHVKTQGGKYIVEASKGYESRTLSSKRLCEQALNGMDFVGNLDFYIWTNDRPDQAEYFRKFLKRDYIFAYSTAKEYERVIPVPDFVYDCWEEVGITSFEKVISDCREQGKKPWEDERIFWIGKAGSIEGRNRLMALSKEHPGEIKAINMGWSKAKDGEKRLVATEYVSLPDHAKYKYLIDIEGAGYSGRLKILLFTGRVVFIAERKWEEYWFDQLKDMENCVFVKNDLSDLLEKKRILDQSDALYHKIAAGGKDLARRISKASAMLYMRQSFEQYGRDQI